MNANEDKADRLIKTSIPCACCGTPYFAAPINGPAFEVWCGSGACTSEAANNGAQGETIKEAADKLDAVIENEDNE